MLRAFSIFGMFGSFLFISPPFRGSVLNILATIMLFLAKYGPYSYILLAISLGIGAIWSLSAPKPQ